MKIKLNEVGKKAISPFSNNIFKSRHDLWERGLTLSHINTLSNASAVDNFWKHCDNKRNCSKQAISPFATMFLTFFQYIVIITFIYRGFPCYCLGNFKVVCCRFVVCGKGLSGNMKKDNHVNVFLSDNHASNW